MTKRILPTPEQLRELLTYDPETGKLYWKERPVSMFKTDDPRGVNWAANRWNSMCAGKEAFTSADRLGYKAGGIFGRLFKAHRVAWAIHTGSWPKEFIDHINMDPSDNSFSNLREATRSENGMNRRAQSNSTSGVKGVYWVGSVSRWRARARVNKVSYYFGDHVRKEDAIAAYNENINKIHGDFSRSDDPPTP